MPTELPRVQGYVPWDLVTGFVNATLQMMKDINAHPCPVVDEDTKLALDFQFAELRGYLESR